VCSGEAPPEELGPKQREAVDLLERNVERFSELVESMPWRARTSDAAAGRSDSTQPRLQHFKYKPTTELYWRTLPRSGGR
jgi:hypothetical protein